MVPALEEILAATKSMVFFGGAGVSTESGIPDFRSVDGLYHAWQAAREGHAPESPAALVDLMLAHFGTGVAQRAAALDDEARRIEDDLLSDEPKRGPDESGRYLIDVCSAAGTHQISLTAEEAAFYGELAIPAGDGEGGDASMLDHCPYCSASFNLAMLPPAGAQTVFAVIGSQIAPKLFFVSPRPLFAWSPAHPRAPPAHV